MTFMILLKPHVWEKSSLLANQIAGYLNSNSITIECIKLIFLHAGTYLLKLEIDDVILHEWGQACPQHVKRSY